VTSPFGEFDNAADDEHEKSDASPMLPPEDRLWRHPSELAGASWNEAESTAVIGRWLSGEGSRGSVWTAGFVGALLAAGVVIVGAHLATAFTAPPLATDHVITTSAITMPPDASPNLGASLAAGVTRVGNSIAVIDTQSVTGVREQALGVVIKGDGVVLTALAAVQGAATVLVDLPGSGITSVGKVVGRDPATGLAVVMVRGESGIPSMQFSTLGLQRESFAVALTSPADAANDPTLSLGNLSAVNVTASTGVATLMDADVTDLSSATNPLGTPILASNGAIEGIVTGSENGNVVITPGWLAGPVAAELTSNRAFTHGQLGVQAETVAGSTHSIAGVKVTKVASGTAPAVASVLRQGDEILSVDGSRVTSLCQLEGQLYVRPAGSNVSLALANGSHRWVAKLTLAA
jgi:S1-C subfamily serine protease